jgi:hypothetical protein
MRGIICLMTKRRFVGIAIACALAFHTAAAQSTIRDRATMHFSLENWTVNPELATPSETPAITLPGGDETFPVLSASGNAGLASIYPELEGLGPIDYSGIDAGLIDFLRKVSTDLIAQKVDEARCSSDRPYLGPVNTYRLKKLPVAVSANFGRPEVLEDASYKARFRLTLGIEETKPFVFVTIQATRQDDEWTIIDVEFDGETYAAFAKQD